MILLDTDIPAFSRYLDASSDYWSRIDTVRRCDDNYVVVDLLHNNAGVLLANLFTGRCVAQHRGVRLAGVLCDHFLSWPSPVKQVRQLASAFGVERFYQIDTKVRAVKSPWAGIAESFKASRIIRRLDRLGGTALRQAVLNLTAADVPIGDLIYDSYLRKAAVATFEKLDDKLREEILVSVIRLKQYRAIMSDPANVACVTSSNSYVDFGGLLRAATRSKKTGYATTNIGPWSVRKYRSVEQCYEFPWPRQCDMQFMRDRLGAALASRSANFFPPQRRLAQENSYFQTAYGDHMVRVSTSDIRTQLNLPSDVPVVAIICPTFDDAPHSIPELLYEDAGQWLKETLTICATLKNVVWMARCHPYAVTIGLTAEFDRIVRPYTERFSNIRICPSNISMESLFPIVDACVTVASTAVLEFASVGTPGIVCGRSFYADSPFAVRPRDRREYESKLALIDRLAVLDPKQVAAAKEAAFMYFHLSFQGSTLFPPVVDASSPDFGIEDISRYWEWAIDLVRNYDFHADPAWRNFSRMEELDRSLLLRFDEIESIRATQALA